MSEGFATFRDLSRFKRDLKAGRKTRADWPLWCWLCGEPQILTIGREGSPVSECNDCFEAFDALARRLEASVYTPIEEGA